MAQVKTENVDNSQNSQEITDLNKKIIRQIEYYFGDINLPKDKFLKAETAKEDGWVSIETLLTFNRLKQLTTNKDEIVSSVEKSKNDLIEINDGKDKMRRNPAKPLPELTEDYKSALNERTLHLKNFPLDSKFEDLLAFCKTFGQVESLEMRLKFKTKKFKGCIFVVFTKKEDAEKMLAGDGLKYKEIALLRENKASYFKRKDEFNEMRKSGKKEIKDENDIKSESKEHVKNGEKNEQVKKEGTVKREKEEDGESDSEQAEVDVNPVKTEGAILKLIGLQKDTNFHTIKQTFSSFVKVEYVEDVNEQLESYVRFGEKNGAITALTKAKKVEGDDGGVTKVDIGGKEIEVKVVEGEEEKNYWIKYNQLKKEAIGKRKKNFGPKRGGKRGHFKKFRRN